MYLRTDSAPVRAGVMAAPVDRVGTVGRAAIRQREIVPTTVGPAVVAVESVRAAATEHRALPGQRMQALPELQAGTALLVLEAAVNR